MAQPAVKYPSSGSLERSELSAEIAKVPGFPVTWAVEAIDMDTDGDIHATLFSGPEARDRAEEYAAAKYASYQMR
jgi:hypothetical protein